MTDVITVAQTDSSQSEIRRRLDADPRLSWGFTVRALRQTAGRGRLGRRWESEGHEVLMWSTWLPAELPAGDMPMLTLAAGLALTDVLGAGLRLKWPNDLLDDYDRKLAGILAEGIFEPGGPRGAIVGVGLNLAWNGKGPPEGLRGRAVSLAELGVQAADPVAAIVEPWLARLRRRVDQLLDGGSRRYAFVADYNARLRDTRRLVRVEAVDGKTVLGYIEGIDETGGILVRRADGSGRIRTHVGELFLDDRP